MLRPCPQPFTPPAFWWLLPPAGFSNRPWCRVLPDRALMEQTGKPGFPPHWPEGLLEPLEKPGWMQPQPMRFTRWTGLRPGRGSGDCPSGGVRKDQITGGTIRSIIGSATGPRWRAGKGVFEVKLASIGIIRSLGCTRFQRSGELIGQRKKLTAALFFAMPPMITDSGTEWNSTFSPRGCDRLVMWLE
ncbi:MAG: hypothetical protein JWM59_317 [Verrucomicrobiales bacterium]|nr:hypothetical protein [Verrucomicrobiales bacterium]